MELRDCFKEDFTQWLLKSNNRIISESESLKDILDIILMEPEADYFWYTYPVGTLSDRYLSRGSKLTYSLRKDEVVPSDSLRVDKEKVKSFLRDYKINQLIN